MVHQHTVQDEDIAFIINPATRELVNTSKKNKLIQGDHNSERLTFEVPRYVDGHDMSLCTKVEVHFNNISADKKNESRGIYPVTDVQVSPASGSVVVFSWLISGNATRYAGILSFLISFKCLTGDTIDYAWHTGLYSDITVGEGMDNGEAVIAEYSDILEAWRLEVLDFMSTLDANLTSLDSKIGEVAAEAAEMEKRLDTLEGLTLLKITDSTAAYEKAVPADVGARAAINRLGALCNPLTPPTNNLCSVDGTIEFNGEEEATVEIGSFSAGEYYLFFNNVEDIGIRLWRLSVDGREIGTWGGSESFTFTLQTRSLVEVYFQSRYSGWGHGYPLLSGKPQIMLCKADDPDKSYKPYAPGPEAVKPVRIESYSATSAEPIDTFEVPAAIRNLPGYGIGRAETECNYIDFDDKTFVYAYELVNGVVTPREPTKIPIEEYLPDYKKYFYMAVDPAGGKLRFVSEGSNDVPSTVSYVKKL